MHNARVNAILSAMWRRLARIPTAFHLWCAERELRGASTAGLSPQQRQERARNLDLLRAYRLRGEFPENRHDPSRLVPCFIDAAGRQCAVAFLMHASAAEEAARKVAEEANYARIREMHFPELASWANDSGLTTAELARIQPSYAATPEQLNRFADIILTLGWVGAFALNSILFNLGRLIWSHSPRRTTMLLGFVCGLFLVWAGLSFQVGSRQYGWHLQQELNGYLLVALCLGSLAVVCAILPIFSRRGK
jgi:hypothetical protein